MIFEKHKNIIIAWLLLLCMLPLSVTKITHRHGRSYTECCSQHANDCSHEHGSDDLCNCQICKFTLSPFVEFETSDLVVSYTIIHLEPVTCLSDLTLEPVHSLLLRGPPVA